MLKLKFNSSHNKDNRYWLPKIPTGLDNSLHKQDKFIKDRLNKLNNKVKDRPAHLEDSQDRSPPRPRYTILHMTNQRLEKRLPIFSKINCPTNQCSSRVAHWLSVPVNPNSNPGGEEKFSSIVFELRSLDCC